MLWPKINSYKEFDDEKKFLRLENSPPPYNFSNVSSLNKVYYSGKLRSEVQPLTYHFLTERVSLLYSFC